MTKEYTAGFISPTDAEIKDACVESSDFNHRRVYVPTEFLLLFAEQNASQCNRSESVDRLVKQILSLYGISSDAFYEAYPRPKGTLWEQRREFGIAETKEALEEEIADSTTVEELVSRLAKKLNIRTGAGMLALNYAMECVSLLDRKQLDYGAKNISSTGVPGVLVRMNDKLNRLVTLLKSGRDPQNEATEDSWKDFANYGLIGLMLHRDTWPTE